jgi:predicted ATPase
VRPLQLLGRLEHGVEPIASLGQLVPLVGRADELAHCLEAATIALDGQGCVLAIVGDAGTGKTRLVEELLHRLVPADIEAITALAVARAFELYSAECQSFQQNTPYVPIQTLLRRLLAFGNGASPSAAALEHEVATRTPKLARFAPLLARFFGLPAAETPLIAALTAEQRRDRLHELIVALVIREAERTPLVLLVDDLQWVDDASHALLAQLATALSGYPVLLLLVYRPDAMLAEPWGQQPDTARVVLGELTDNERVALVRAMLGGEPPEELFALIERAQGNPFFIEELIRTLVEQQALLPSEPGWRLSAAAERQQLPDTIEGVITARLDLLAEQERDVLQVASVIGRRFPEPVLRGIYTADDVLGVALPELAADNLIQPDDAGRERAYLFRQALTREVAYESILFARRRELNREVARCIEALYSDNRATQLAPLARYYLLAEEWAIALRYHLEAGQRAAGQFANRSATVLFEQALAIAPRLVRQDAGAALQSDWQRLGEAAPLVVQVLEELGSVLTITGSYDEALLRYREALDLLKGNPVADAQHLGRIYCQISATHERKGDFEQAFAMLEQGRALLGDTPSVELTRIYLLGAGLHHRRGSYTESVEWAEHARSLAEKIGSDRDQAHVYLLLGGNYHALGETEAAIANTQRSLEMFRQVEDFAGIAKAHNNLAGILHDTGEWDQARRAYRSAAEIEQMLGDVYQQAKLANNLGEVLRGLGDVDGAIEQYNTARRSWSGSQFGNAVITMNLGAAYLLRGDLQQSDELLRHSRDLFDQIGSEDFLPELLRYQAELALLRSDALHALQIAQEAAAMARRLETPLEEGAAVRVQAQALLQLHRYNAAAQAATAALTLLHTIGSPHELAKTKLVAAQIAAAQQRHDDGQQALNEAVELLTRLQAQWDLQQAQQIAETHRYALPSF